MYRLSEYLMALEELEKARLEKRPGRLSETPPYQGTKLSGPGGNTEE